MPLSTAEKNRRKRQRKRETKQQHEENDKADGVTKATAARENESDLNDDNNDDVEIEYVAEPVASFSSALGVAAPAEALQVLQRFQDRARAIVVTDDESLTASQPSNDVNSSKAYDYNDNDDEEDSRKPRSKRKLREMLRPSVADLKRHVQRPDLVEAHDVSAPDPEFLLQLKSCTGTVPVPRHWGRKRKYLQNKRGFEKPPFKLPDFLVATGITALRDSVSQAETDQSIRQKNRQRVAPKMGAMDVDYKVLYDAFFKHQTKPTSLTKFGDTYYEGKELETQHAKYKPGGPLSQALRDALGMTSPSVPPPWLWNFQRYGPPPSYPLLLIPGLNAPLPTPECQYGFHPGGWGKPPVDAYGRLIYGGNPLDPPGSTSQNAGANGGVSTDKNTPLATSSGKTVTKAPWGALPMGEWITQEDEDEDESDVEESNDEESNKSEMDESDDENIDNNGQPGFDTNGVDSVLPPPPPMLSGPLELRKPGDETPLVLQQQKALYQVVQQTQAASNNNQAGAVFASTVQYVLPGTNNDTSIPASAASVVDGAASVLSKPAGKKQRNKNTDDDDDTDIGKDFKF